MKNDGHLIRVVGPAFEMVSSWERDGIPLKIACQGIDRCFERYHRARPRRRPVRVEFCEADVLDVFDQWRRAVGLPARRHDGAEDPLDPNPGCTAGQDDRAAGRRGRSLRAHLERAAVRLTGARATGRIGPSADTVLDGLAAELDLARERARGLRGEARQALLDRLLVLDKMMIDAARDGLDAAERSAVEDEARQQLETFRARMPADRYERALQLAVDRLVRERAALPVLPFA
jgi:hypothetical protein